MNGDRVGFVRAVPPVTPKAVATRRLLLSAAAELFSEHGYGDVSMQDIAIHAGLTKGAVYGHFRSKGQLLVEVIVTKLGELAQQDGPPETGPRREAGLGLLLLTEENRAFRFLEVDAAAAARHDPDVAAGLSVFYRDRQARIQVMVTGQVSDPETVAWLLSALAAGIGAKGSVGIEQPTVERLYAVLSRLVDAGTQSDPRPSTNPEPP